VLEIELVFRGGGHKAHVPVLGGGPCVWEVVPAREVGGISFCQGQGPAKTRYKPGFPEIFTQEPNLQTWGVPKTKNAKGKQPMKGGVPPRGGFVNSKTPNWGIQLGPVNWGNPFPDFPYPSGGKTEAKPGEIGPRKVSLEENSKGPNFNLLTKKAERYNFPLVRRKSSPTRRSPPLWSKNGPKNTRPQNRLNNGLGSSFDKVNPGILLKGPNQVQIGGEKCHGIFKQSFHWRSNTNGGGLWV